MFKQNPNSFKEKPPRYKKIKILFISKNFKLKIKMKKIGIKIL